MTAMVTFVSGVGCAMFFIYGWQQLYELIRHRSLLEYQTPEISTEFCLMAGLGLILWVLGAFLS
jgi:hypothetical protein